MSLLPVVEDLDPLENDLLCGPTCRLGPHVNEFGQRIVVAIAGLAHRGDAAASREERLIGVSGIVAAASGVVLTGTERQRQGAAASAVRR